MTLPLTPSDLREIARIVDTTRRIFGESADWDCGHGFTKYGDKFGQIRLDVLRSGTDDDVVGYITYEDGWLGFVPMGESNA